MIAFWIVLFAAAVVVVFYWLSPGSAMRLRRGPFAQRPRERDPVCGMIVEVSRAPARALYGGRYYWFCSTGCKEKFDAHPDEYVKAGTPPGAHANA